MIPQAEASDIQMDRVVRGALAGSATCERAIAKRAYTLALRTAVAVVQNRDLAHEVAQDVTVDVLHGLSRLRDSGAFDSWVHRITSRHARRALRRRAVLRRRQAPMALAEAVAARDSSLGTVEIRLALAEAMRTLSARERLALALRYVHDLSDADMAAALVCRPGTVHALLSRARKKLRESPQLHGFAPTSQGDGSDRQQ